MWTFSDQGIAFLKWLYDRKEQVMAMFADFDRLREKVDGMRGGGAVQVTNLHRGNIVVSSEPSQSNAPTPGVGKTVVVKITSAASGGGKYNGRIWLAPTVAISASGTLAATDLGTDPGSDNALVLNNEELGQATHDLTSGTVKVQFFVGVVRGATSAGLLVVVINGIDWEACS